MERRERLTVIEDVFHLGNLTHTLAQTQWHCVIAANMALKVSARQEITWRSSVIVLLML